MTRALASPRRAVVVVVLALAALVGGPTGVSGQTADAPAPTAIPSQDGWWNRAKGPQQGEPDNPLRSSLGGSIPAPSTVPANALGVGAAAGDADKVAAIGLVLEAGIDPLVDSLVLTLKESAANGSNLNSSSARIIACPITSFWAGVKDGDWVNRPTCDDSQAVAGVRAADGTWTFDLTLLAMQWVDATSGLDQNGVLLTEAVDAPMSFQVSFDDISTGKVTTAFSATPGFSDEELGFSDEELTTFEEEPAGEETFVEEPVAEDFGSTFADDGSTFESSDVAAAPMATTPPATAPDAGAPVAATSALARPAGAIGLFDAVPIGVLLFLLLLFVGTALLLGVVLGPIAAPTPAVVRSGGVSRALAARADADADAARRR